MMKKVLFAALITATFAASATIVIKIEDKSGFQDAISDGDVRTIHRLLNSEQDKNVKVLLQAGAYRISGNLAESSSLAKRCYEPDSVATTGSRSMLCGLLLAGNDLADGDIASWARTSQDIKTKTAPMYAEFIKTAVEQQAVKQDGSSQGVIDAQYVIDLFSVVDDYKPFASWPYKTTITRSENGPDIIPVIWQGGVVNGRSSRLPFIEVQINGKTVQGLLDTGTGDNMLLSAADAERVGIDHITPGWQHVMYVGSATSTSSLGNAKVVKVGNTTLGNVPVVVTNTRIAVIGLNLIRQLGASSLSSEALTVSPIATACKDPLAMGSLVSGGHEQLRYPIEIRDEAVRAVIDTGAPMLAYELRDSLPVASNENGRPAQGTTTVASLDGTSIPYVTAHGDFSIAGVTHRNMGYPIFKGQSLNHSAIGAWLLRDNDIVMDFPQGHLCLVPRSSTGTGDGGI